MVYQYLLNCNADQELSQRIISAIFAFFFGFVYLIINYYTYKVLGQGKICKMDRDKLFPLKCKKYVYKKHNTLKTKKNGASSDNRTHDNAL